MKTRMFALALGLGLLLALASTTSRTQEQPDTLGARLVQDSAVRGALDHLRATEPALIDEQIRLCEIPAPPFKEAPRAEAYRRLFTELGLENVRIDKVGNVLGERPGRAARPHLVFSAHLDTVFPEGTDVSVTRDGPVLRGPGIGDDCRGLAVLLGVVRALNHASIVTPGTIIFVGTVGEEGLGDLRGVKHLFAEELKGRVDRFVSIDGTGLGITHIGVGSKRYRVTFKGPGGHSYGAFGLANPIHALGRAMALIGDFEVPSDPKTTYNVGRVGGGTSINAIPFEAWMEVDMRSADAAALATLDGEFHKAVDRAVEDENARWKIEGPRAIRGRGDYRVTVVKDLVGDRPAGRTDASAAIVRAAVSATEALKLTAALDEGSTDSNIAMSLGIPAITIDGGGRGTGAHALDESFDTTDSWQGTQRALLVAIALARP
jgi:acetylornithine deacetylase/succinyl-diaminopimelate desuccinylase-like protein